MATNKYKHIVVPSDGVAITVKNKKMVVPDNPIIPVIEGDGIGRDLMKATRRVVDAAVAKAYNGKRKIVWMDVYAGEKANELYKEWLPQETLDAIKKYVVALKGPLPRQTVPGYAIHEQFYWYPSHRLPPSATACPAKWRATFPMNRISSSVIFQNPSS